VALLYVWTDDGKIVFAVGDEPRVVKLRFDLVNELHMYNELSAGMIAEPALINWSVSEVALFEVLDSVQDDTAQSQHFIRARFLWEGPRHVDIMFRTLSVTMQDATSMGTSKEGDPG
jgi:hypothetical protein